MKFYFLSLLIFLTMNVSYSFAMGSKPLPELETAQNIDLNRYTGKWYEIARIQQSFESGCVGVTAEYAQRADGKIDVKNTCKVNSCAGRVSVANGVARVVDHQSNAKLKVSFFWPFEGDYWVLEVDPEYSYAVVGSPDRKSFWILSRTPTLSDALVQSILSHFQAKGFDLSSVVLTQACE